MQDKQLREQVAKLKPKAVFDHRHPIMYEESIAMGVAVLTRYFAALQRRDLRAMAAELHFPHAAIEETDVVLLGSAEELVSSPPPSMDVSRLPEGAFDLFMGIATHTSDPVRAGLTLSYSRHQRDGAKRCVCDGLYVATQNDGRWGLHVSSTIFTPVEHIAVQYPEALDYVFKRGHDWMEGWSRSDAELLDSTRNLLGRSVSLSPNITGLGRDLGHVFRTEGVQNRLRVTDTTEIAPGTYDFEHFRKNVASHGVGGYSHTLYRSDARVLHQARNKVHVAGGYERFQADHTPISVTWSLGVHVRRHLRWGSVAGTGNTIHYDATNNA
jgi:hypothetical protein